jgi:hypothetical protein
VGVEEDIAQRLLNGATPKQLVAAGFRKSTVYKVADGLRSHQVTTPVSQVLVDLNSDHPRYLPGQTASLTFTVTNRAPVDFYLFQCGVRPEWFPDDQWIPSAQRRLVGSGASLAVRFTVPIPQDEPLGDKHVFFGVQGQWVGPQAAAPSNEIMWAGPLPLQVQHPLNGDTIFLSHSVTDLSVISKLESTLDDYGIATIATADGGDTDAQIAAATYFVAVVTSLTSVPAVTRHITAALTHGKHPILLRDQSLAYAIALPDLTWIDVPFTLGGAAAIPPVFEALKELEHERALKQAANRDETLGLVLLALGAAAVAVAIGKGGGVG